MADTPGYPDTNPAMVIDPRGRLWLFYPTILANLWESALMKYRISSDYQHEGTPRWSVSEVMHITPGTNFVQATLNYAKPYAEWVQQRSDSWPEEDRKEARRFLNYLNDTPVNKLQRRLGWMTRAHPVVLDGTRLVVPLYSDGYSFSLMAFSDNWGDSWQVSSPLCGAGNIQPSVVRRHDGSLFAMMRDNGPPPKRLMASSSSDRGETWTPVVDTDLPNPGSGAEVIGLKNGHWALIGNDTERGRYSLAVWISEDEGRTWKWKRHLELDLQAAHESSYHYPSLLQSRDGTLHATYSHHPAVTPRRGRLGSIKHAHFNEAWVRAGDR
jgi:predicted neuraminidase